ncbi:hypothetical protein ACFWNR_36735 [Streptomyces virginiae]|uniref:hypothetical protein n=1 Tax=Streptomyces virginiae TaxID=1961 RepID=UPI003656A335
MAAGTADRIMIIMGRFHLAQYRQRHPHGPCFTLLDRSVHRRNATAPRRPWPANLFAVTVLLADPPLRPMQPQDLSRPPRLAELHSTARQDGAAAIP